MTQLARASQNVLKALAVVCELTGTQLSEAAVRVMARDLGAYPEDQVLGALNRCRKELRPRELTLFAIISRLDDGRPGPEEAWALISPWMIDVGATTVATDEMRVASGVAQGMIEEDRIGARMAFLESYRQLVQIARDNRVPVKWEPILGWDASGREGPLVEAVKRGRLGAAHVAKLLPYRQEPAPEVAALLANKSPALLEKPREPA
jgi:hypothetical protein